MIGHVAVTARSKHLNMGVRAPLATLGACAHMAGVGAAGQGGSPCGSGRTARALQYSSHLTRSITRLLAPNHSIHSANIFLMRIVSSDSAVSEGQLQSVKVAKVRL